MSNFCLEKLEFFENLPEKFEFFLNLPGKIEIFRKFAWKNWNFLWNCLKKSKLLGNLPGKIEIFFTRIHDPQISNQIDAAAPSQLGHRLMVNSISSPYTTATSSPSADKHNWIWNSLCVFEVMLSTDFFLVIYHISACIYLPIIAYHKLYKC